jgi:type II secretory pathway pseudopilin PulG
VSAGHTTRRPAVSATKVHALLELLAFIVILSAVAAVAVPRLVASADEARRSACAQNKASINAQVERWFLVKGEWPNSNLQDIGSDPRYFPHGLPRCPVTGGNYRLSTATHRVTGHDH